jgi:flagellar biosynthetic protein FliR
MGLALASIADPATESASTVVGQVFELLAFLLFFALDIHHVFLGLVYASFVRWPVGGTSLPLTLPAAVDGVGAAHEWGLLLAAPLAVCLFSVVIVLSLLARAAPQLNLLTIGFALRLAVGLVVAVALMPQIVWGLTCLLRRAGLFLGYLI